MYHTNTKDPPPKYSHLHQSPLRARIQPLNVQLMNHSETVKSKAARARRQSAGLACRI